MVLHKELGLTKSFRHVGHETLLSVVITSQLFMKEAQALLSSYDMTISQFNILLMLKIQGKNGRLNQTQLGSLVISKRSGISGLIDRMEQSGLVKRIPDNQDRRVNFVEMTEYGREKLENVEIPYFTCIENITSILSPEEHMDIRAILEKLRIKMVPSGL